MKHLVLVLLLARLISTAEVEFFDNLVIPSDAVVAVDESIYIKLLSPIDGQTKCSYKAPGQKDFDKPDPFVEFSDHRCGIKISKVQKTHAGLWQLTSSANEKSVMGTSVLVVEDAVVTAPSLANEIFSSADDFAPPGYNLSYCYVSRKIGSSQMSEINKHSCMIPQTLPADFSDGEWDVRLGLLGKSKEFEVSANIQSTDETIDTEVSRIDSENIQLLCRLRNLKNVLTFCRFERDGNFGINLRDGTVQDNYRYFGDGFDKGHCGLEINRIAGTDKTQWRCFVGAIDIDDFNNMKIADAAKRIHKYSAVIDASDAWDKLKSLYEEGEGRETLNVGAPVLNDQKELFFVDNQMAIIQCNANNPFDYCWFQHPVHRILSVSDKKPRNDDDDVQYFGDGFKLGHCGVRIRRLHFSDAGEWVCGLGRVTKSMKEAVKTIQVQVKASSMMAITKQIEDFSRNSIVIQCRAIPLGSGLASCHFLTPTQDAFSINEMATQADAIDGLYYFDPNRKMSDGYCTVVVKELSKKKHAGKWMCIGRILGHDDESYDSIYVTVDGLRGASFSLLSLYITLPLVVVLAGSAFGFRRWKKRQQASLEALEEISMHTIDSNNTEITTSSEDSRGSVCSATCSESVMIETTSAT